MLITNPPPTSFTTLSEKKKEKNVACDTWHVTCDMWYVTRDMWHVTGEGRWTFSQSFSSLALTTLEWRFVEYLEEKADSLPFKSVSDKGVCRTAPATQGLLESFPQKNAGLTPTQFLKKSFGTLFPKPKLLEPLEHFCCILTHAIFW